MFKLPKSVTVYGSRWTHVTTSELGREYVTLHRHPSRSMVERLGMVVTAIDVIWSAIPAKRQGEIRNLLLYKEAV